MKHNKLKIAYLNINRFNPLLSDGVSVSTLDLLQFLADQGHETAIMTYCTHEPFKQKIFYQVVHQHDPGLIGKAVKSFSFMVDSVSVYQELMPFSQTELVGNQKHILKSMNQKIVKDEIDFLITTEDDLLSLLPGTVLGIPGAHFFHSPAYLSSFQRSPFSRKFLGKKILGLNPDIWYPLFDLDKYRLKNRRNKKNQAGYYSAGRHKGDEVFNRLVLDLPDWNFSVLGQHYTHGFDTIPKNLKIWGENPDCRQFYDSIGLLLVPSLSEEGFPRVILEAAANSIPAVANAIGGIPEAMGDSGIQVKLGSTELEHPGIEKLVAAYREAIQHINADDVFYQKLQQRAFKRARAYESSQAKLSMKNLKKMLAG
jgi:glycosyltransferase involved in cell wall biosynthesis